MDSTVTTPGAPTGSVASEPNVPIVDARPILRRTEDNIWDRTERLRSQLYDLVEATCRKLGFEALVLQSDPYVHPAWVKVEAWKPARGGALTARASMIVTITAMPYHLYEAVYRVEWERQGRSGVTDQLYAFREHEVRQMLIFLVTNPSVPIFGPGETRWILGSVQLRTKWWHIWKPKNKVVALRRDRLALGSLALFVGGGFLALGGMPGVSGGPEYSGDYDPSFADTTAVAPVADTVMPMSFDTIAVAVPTDTGMAFAADTTMAPATDGSIYANQAVTGWLDENDPAFAGTTAHYDEWRYYAQAGERITVIMRSPAFPTFVTIGQVVGGEWRALASSDDAAGDGWDSSIVLVVPSTGEYLIAAGSVLSDQTGSYWLQLDRVEGF